MGFTRPDDLFPESGSLKSNRFKILVVDDDESLREFLEIFLANEGYLIRSAANGEGALELLAREDVSLVISDVRMPGIDGVALLKEIKTSYPDLPVILITAFASMDSAVAAMKEGAWDYLTKPFRLEEIRDVVEKALETRPETQTVNRQSAEKVFKLDGMVARSPAMLKIFQLVPRIASSLSSVLVSGESGTGKELVARAVHNLGTRKEKAFVTVNCGGIPENLLESELFGYCRGAFTGADIEKPGLFAIADGGTIFLDEIGELPMMLQVKLLRVVQEKAFIPVGSTTEQKVNVRIIAATNRDLEEEVMAGNFREDLYYRLNVIQIRMPSLKERPEDIPILVQYFLDKYSREQEKAVQGISSFAMKALMEYSFPGNVRELENIIERSIALATSSLLLPESLSLARFKEQQSKNNNFRAYEPEIPFGGLKLDQELSRIEKVFLLKALEKTGGVKTEAAQLLGLNFRSFRYRLAKYDL